MLQMWRLIVASSIASVVCHYRLCCVCCVLHIPARCVTSIYTIPSVSLTDRLILANIVVAAATIRFHYARYGYYNNGSLHVNETLLVPVIVYA